MMYICTNKSVIYDLYGTRHILVIAIFDHGLNVSFDMGHFWHGKYHRIGFCT